MRNLFIVFYCLVSALTIKANGQDSLWKIQTTDYHGTYYGATVAKGGLVSCRGKNRFLFAMSC